MTDHKLLELAAKAAGIAIDKSPYNGGGHGNTGFDMLGNAVLDWHEGTKWNPLTDDGDALRLAVRLKINVFWRENLNGKFVIAEKDGMNFYPEPVNEGDDPEAATCRAIVRAAAAIGKELTWQTAHIG